MVTLIIRYLESVGARCPALSVLLCLLGGYGLGMELPFAPPLTLMLVFIMVGGCLVLLSQRADLQYRLLLSSRMFYWGVCAILIGIFAYRASLGGLQQPESIERWAEQGRAELVRSIESEGLNHDVSLLSGAMSLGYRGEGDEFKALKRGFAHAGVAHIMVLSGLHVSLVAWLITMLMSRIPYVQDQKWIQSLALMLGLWGFVFFVGLGAPAVRAALTLSLLWVGRLRRRPTHYVNLLCVSAVIQLLLDPSLFYSWSFRLSYVAVISIYLYYPIFLSIFSGLKHPFLRYCFEALALTCSAQMLVLPLCFYLFGEISWAWIFSSAPVGLLSLAFISLSLLSYLILLVLGVSFDWLLSLLGWLGGSILDLVNWASRLPYLHQDGELPLFGLTLYYAIALGGVLWLRVIKQEQEGRYPFRQVIFNI